MSTNATLAVKEGKRIMCAYLHYDAYPSRLLPIFNEFYCSYKAAYDLVLVGDLKGLNSNGSVDFPNERELSPWLVDYCEQIQKRRSTDYAYFFSESHKEWLLVVDGELFKRVDL